jgi:hypothetical protein
MEVGMNERLNILKEERAKMAPHARQIAALEQLADTMSAVHVELVRMQAQMSNIAAKLTHK